MTPARPLQLDHSWPLFERGQRFDLGFVGDGEEFLLPGPAPFSADARLLADHGIGLWQCDLADSSLTWSAEVFDLFGLPRDAVLSRPEIVALYCEESRAAMERLRAYAIKHRRGFTLDAEIRTVGGEHRWMRLSAAPMCVGGRVVRLHGLKRDVTHEYR
ncbi:PAS domain-containing protein [Sphingomonas sp. PR090111-T3T-6A]|uniref:PAS domain-containing protein n=1 Tax=Sphingomonas sp. PR090111-T3T-6A TaxID=685778 RepID=UPI0003A714EB|nr:PAS domain-containing protein [Sphingomonas sp. PR090111-T3T-6A]